MKIALVDTGAPNERDCKRIELYGQVEADKAAEYLRAAHQVAADVEKLLPQEDCNAAQQEST